jgi:Protein of unknown function, DUF547
MTKWAMLTAVLGLAVGLQAPSPVHAESVNPIFKRVTAGSAATVDHSVWDALLKAHVVAGPDGLNRVSYSRLKGEQSKLKAYLAALQKVDPSTLDKPEQFAFWVNLYNAKTIDVVLDKYPVKSIKDISLGGGLKTLVTGGPWQAKIMKVSGVDLSLDDIENTILRPIYGDPRVHYTVNCASVGCPNLSMDAYTGAKLEAMLEAGAKAFINSPRGVAIDGDKITASSIYDWFKADFGGSEATVFAHWRKYASPELTARLEKITKIAGYNYDWALADAK